MYIFQGQKNTADNLTQKPQHSFNVFFSRTPGKLLNKLDTYTGAVLPAKVSFAHTTLSCLVGQETLFYTYLNILQHLQSGTTIICGWKYKTTRRWRVQANGSYAPKQYFPLGRNMKAFIVWRASRDPFSRTNTSGTVQCKSMWATGRHNKKCSTAVKLWIHWGKAFPTVSSHSEQWPSTDHQGKEGTMTTRVKEEHIDHKR